MLCSSAHRRRNTSVPRPPPSMACTSLDKSVWRYESKPSFSRRLIQRARSDRCVCTTPFCCPVVPDVKSSSGRSADRSANRPFDLKTYSFPGSETRPRTDLASFLYCCFARGSRRKAQRETPWTSPNRIILIQENWEGCGQKGLFSQLFAGPPGAVCQSRPIFKTTASV